MNMIGGLDEPTAGHVLIDGEDIGHKSANAMIAYRLHHIGFVFQAYNLIPVLTALENVSFVMLLQGVKKRERQQRAQELLASVGLMDKLDKRPNELSGGQQQRVAVARALASRPRFVLADEPTANLDSHSTNDLIDLMAELNRKDNMTFLFATHDQRVIDRARRVVTLEDGRIVKDEAAHGVFGYTFLDWAEPLLSAEDKAHLARVVRKRGLQMDDGGRIGAVGQVHDRDPARAGVGVSG